MPELDKGVLQSMLTSKNGMYHALAVRNKTKKGENLGSYLYVFNDEFDVLYSYDNFFDVLNGHNLIDELIIGDNSKFYALIKSFKSASDADEDSKVSFKIEGLQRAIFFINNQRYKYYLLCASEKNEGSLTELIAPDGKFIRYATVMNIGTQLYLAGALSNTGDLNYSGVFFQKLDSEFVESIEVTNYNEFSEEFLTKYLSERDQRLYDKAKSNADKNLWDYHDFANRGVVPFNDGYIAFMEQYATYTYAVTTTATPQRISTTYYDVAQNDYVFATYISKTGEIVETFKIPKQQSFIGRPSFMSAYKVIGDQLYFLFTDMDMKKSKYEQMILYVYDKDFSKTTYQVYFPVEVKNGLKFFNEWVSDNYLLGFGLKSFTKKHFVKIDFTEYSK